MDQNGVTLNINSAKGLNGVAGHEVTHVMEGTQMYDSLREAVFAYAESKGELQKRRSDLEKLYANVKGADIDGELTADLVGDYIFTDEDFVRSLHAGNRNLFHKIWGEIKYLLKIAAAGSKEARQLEKAKKLFEDVYREASAEKSTTRESGVRYSLSQAEEQRGKVTADFIQEVSKMVDTAKKSKRKLKIGDISENHAAQINRLMQTINTKFSAEGYELWIDGTGASHIEDRHGENINTVGGAKRRSG